MLFAFHLIGNLATQRDLYSILASAAGRYGDIILPELGYSVPKSEVDAAIILGIGGRNGIDSHRVVFDAYRALGKPVLIFDNGYFRRAQGETYYRVSINSLQPNNYLLEIKYPEDRLRWLCHHRGLDIKPYKNSKLGADRRYILFDGANQSFCTWHGLGDQGIWAAMTVAKIRQNTSLPIIYRSKGGVNSVPGASPSIVSLEQDVAQAIQIVSYGGNIGWDAMISGTPHFAIGESIARPLSTTTWDFLPEGINPDDDVRSQWLSNVCYCQWTIAELAEGIAWPHIRYQMELARG